MRAIKIPCEHDLLSTNHNVWADAVMRCTGGNPYCGADRYCHAGGECFADQTLTREQAILEVDRLSQELHSMRRENDRLRMSSEMLIGQLEEAVKQNSKSRNSQRVFALRFCIGEIKRSVGTP